VNNILHDFVQSIRDTKVEFEISLDIDKQDLKREAQTNNYEEQKEIDRVLLITYTLINNDMEEMKDQI